MTTPTPEEQAKLMTGWDLKVAARIEQNDAKAVFIKYAGGLASNMTLRDHFAGQAMAASLREEEWMQMFGTANFAYEMADAMLEARKTTGETKP